MSTDLVVIDDRWSLWPRFALRSAGLPFDTVTAFAVPGLVGDDAMPDAAGTTRDVTADAMWSALADDTFMAALVWQNPSVVETWAGRLAGAVRSGGRAPLSRRNERERVVARYVQRYSTKNESIGFFGPVAWGLFGPATAPLRWRGGLGIRSGTVAFEVWAVTALADSWSRLPRVRPHVPVRLHPAATVDAGTVIRPRRPPVPLDAAGQALVAELGAGRPFGATVAAAANARGLDPALVGEAAEELAAAGLLQVGFLIPFDEHPERRLRAHVERISDSAVRAGLLAHLDRLDRAREEVAAVARDPVRLPTAMDGLAEALAGAGGSDRRSIPRGGMGRRAVYLDCRRDLDAEVGGDLVDALRAPLALLLRSAEWITAEVAGVVERHLAASFARLSQQRDVVTLADLQAAGTEVLLPGNDMVAAVAEDFRLRWAEVIPPSGGGPATRDCATIRPIVEALFPRSGRATWAAARHHTPDLLICRERDGSYRWVVGELHVALNTLESRLFATQCEDRVDLVAATAADFRNGRVVPLYPIDGVASNSRTYPPPALDPPGAFRYWSFAGDAGHEHGHRSVPATAVRVTVHGGRLVGQAQGWRAPVTEFFGEFLTALCVNMFRLRAPGTHAPRVLFDEVVVCRETWRVPASTLPLPRSRTDDYTYATLRGWARRRGIPRHIFVHVPHEPKPVYADLAAPALMDDLARLVRAAAARGDSVTITEMLPGPDELWLVDSAGRRCTAELRVVAARSAGGEPVVEETR